jgi:hypothetical protein
LYLKGRKTDRGENCIMMNFITCILYLRFVTGIKSRRMRWAGHVARMGEGRGAYRILVERPYGKRPLRRPRLRGEDNIKMDLRETGIHGANWTRLAQDRSQWRVCMNTGSIKKGRYYLTS